MFVHTWVKTWYVADEDCRSKGMQLVTINSEIENVQVVHLAERFDLEAVWIGGKGMRVKKFLFVDDWLWIWIPSGRPIEAMFGEDDEPSGPY